MHYSPQSLQLGAEVQAQVDFNAGESKFGFQYGPRPEEDQTPKYVAGALVAFGLFMIFRKR